jgi:uncharacterized low-complexity protein
MNKKSLALSVGGALATILATAPIASADSNPFGMKAISPMQLAQADAATMEGDMGKMKEGKCGEGKCGAGKKKMADMAAPTAKAAEGKCGAGKKMGEQTDKAAEGKCGAGKKMDAEKMK